MNVAEANSKEKSTSAAGPPPLFTPLTIRGVTLPNRIAVSPMCEYSSEDGFANDWHLVHLGSRATGGAGLVIAEATAITADGRITYGDLGIWKNEHVPFLKRITTFLKSQGSVPGIQLAHAGRKASSQLPWDGGAAIPADQPNGWQTVAPSPIPFRPADPDPRELTVSEIADLVTAFGDAADRAIAAGFEVIEIHGAHGYLINEFLSPVSNHRTDQYGGSFDNRIRFLSDIVSVVRARIGSQTPLLLRISATDYAEGGWTLDDSIELARRVKALGVDLIDASSGGNVATAKVPLGPGYQVPFAERVRKDVGILTGAVGLITDPHQANEIVLNEQADVILLAREMLRDPYFALHAAQALGAKVESPKQYQRAFPGSVIR